MFHIAEVLEAFAHVDIVEVEEARSDTSCHGVVKVVFALQGEFLDAHNQVGVEVGKSL